MTTAAPSYTKMSSADYSALLLLIYLLVTSNYVRLLCMEKDLEALEQAMSQLHRAMSRHRAWENIAHEAGINLDRTSAVILQLLACPANADCQLHEIAEKLSIEAPSVTRKVQLLEQAGLLKKEVDKKDGRAYRLQLTTRGIDISKRLKTVKRENLKKTLTDWPPAERQKLAKLIQKFADSITSANDLQQKTIITK